MAYIGMNRRIGSRTDVRVPVTLQRQQQRGFLRRRGRHVEAVILNVSVSGLEVECHPLPATDLHDRLIVRTSQGTAMADLRRIQVIADDLVRYGLLLLESDRGFESVMYEIASSLHAEPVDWVWETAH